jgi:hypothetical protein
VKTLQLADGRMVSASKYGRDEEEAVALELTDDEKVIKEKIKVLIKYHKTGKIIILANVETRQI